jgi:hypothetical protein
MIAALALAGTLYHGVTVVQTGLEPLTGVLSVAPKAGLERHLMFIERGGGAALRNFNDDMTKKQHMIVVSDDLRYFRHVHPLLHPDGTFTIDYYFPRSGLYHIYMDGIPHAWGRQVFRFDVPIGAGARALPRTVHAQPNSVAIGPYRVTIDQTNLPVDQVSLLTVHVTKGGADATDLHPYLGTNAHGIIIGLRDLSYVHVHAMSKDMIAMANAADCGDAMMQSTMPLPNSASVPPVMQFYVLLPRAQPYDLWLQFRGGNKLYAAPLLLIAR